MFKMDPNERRDLNADNMDRNNKYYNQQRHAFMNPPNHQYGFGSGTSEDWGRCGPLAVGRNPVNQRSGWYGPTAYSAYPDGGNYYGSGSWRAPYRQQQPPLEPVEYSIPIQFGGSHRTEDELTECRYYNGVFRRGTPRPMNFHCYGNRQMAEDETMDTDNDSGSTPELYSALIPPSPQEYRCAQVRVTRSMSRRSSTAPNQPQPNQRPSTSNRATTDTSSNQSTSQPQSKPAEAEQQTERPVKKSLLGRFSLRNKRNGNAENAVDAANNDKKETTDTMKKLSKGVESSEKSVFWCGKSKASSQSEPEGTATNTVSQLSSGKRTNAVTTSRLNTLQAKSLKRLKNKTVGVKLPGGAAVKADRTSKWEKVAMKSRALFLKNRSQKMLKERLSKYRLVSPRLNTSALDDPMTSDTTIRTLAITRKTSSVARRLADLNRSQNKAVTKESKANDVNVTATPPTPVATNPANTESQVTDALECTAHTPLASSSAVSMNDLSFTPFFQCDDWRKLVQEARQEEPLCVTTLSTPTVSSSTPVIAPSNASVIRQSDRSQQQATTSNCSQNLDQTPVVPNNNKESPSSPGSNVEVSNEMNSPTEVYVPAPIKVEIDDERHSTPDVDKTLIRTSLSSCASVGTSDVSIGCLSPDFSSMDDDAKLKHMWSLVAKETSLNASRIAVDEKLSKIQAEVIALLNERNKIESELSTLRETKNRLLQSAGNHAPLHDSFVTSSCNNK